MIGTLVNTTAILIGSSLGLLLGNRLPHRAQETILNGLGLVTLLIGFQLALQTRNVLIVMFSILLGGIGGEALRLDDHLNALARQVETTIGNLSEEAAAPAKPLSQALITASLLFCIGPIAVLGPIQDGLLADPNLLMVKSVLDFFSSIALAASLGPGVILSAIPVFLYQGVLSVSAASLAGAFRVAPTADTPAIAELTATGGIIIVGLGLNLLNIKKVRVANFLPAILFAPLFAIGLNYITKMP